MPPGLILGDHLSADLPILAALDKGRDRPVMAEVVAEATYVPRHQHRLAYKARNRLDDRRSLPAFYWHGDTAMACMRECQRNTLDHGYAHHFQRLTVTGNFTLLADVIPDVICGWYLSVYVDACEWVALANTLGMVITPTPVTWAAGPTPPPAATSTACPTTAATAITT